MKNNDHNGQKVDNLTISSFLSQQTAKNEYFQKISSDLYCLQGRTFEKSIAHKLEA